ncbi:MAG: ABC transporter substrate-binding protein [Rhodospirillaceae bacterium]|nr:ABC transporter substrate-binding protein [Rhodospirillaceae bacterium]
MTIRFLSAVVFGLTFFFGAGFAQAADKELRMALISGPPSLGNPYTGVGPPSSFVWEALFDMLVQPDENGELQPRLALSWEVVEPTRWRFKLRPNVTFSNGEPFNADAVVATLKWLRRTDEGKRTLVSTEVGTIADAVAVDALTVDVITTKPDAILPKRLTAAAIVAPKAWRDLGPEGFAQTPSGTGPYVVKSWKHQGGQVLLEANRSSWRKPVIDRIVFVMAADSVARSQSMLAGRIDILNIVTPEVAAAFEGTDYKAVVSQTAQVYSIAFETMRNGTHAVNDQRVRQAINYAVNKENITNVVMRGTMRSASQGATPATFGYDPALKPYPYDPAKAKALLADAGYAKGLKMTAEIVTNGMSGGADYLPLVQQDLRAVGIDLEIRSVVFSDWLRKYTSNSFDVDMFGLSWNGAPYYDSLRALEYHSCAKANPFFCDTSVMPLIEAAGREFDVEKRRTLLRSLAGMARDAAPALFLYEVTDISVISPKVLNYEVKLRVPVYEKLDLAGK